MSEDEVAATPMAPTNLAYTSYLLAVAYGGSFPEALGAVLPCYWIYWEVGKALLQRGSPNPLYQRWIETYGGEEFAVVVRAVLALTDRLGPQLAPRRRGAHARTVPHHEPIRVDVLGDGLPPGALARGLAALAPSPTACGSTGGEGPRPIRNGATRSPEE
jgi:TENA/THI-4/PQQC family